MENLAHLFSMDMVMVTLRMAIPLILASIGSVICERSGIINLGIEGMMLMGAIGAVMGTWSCTCDYYGWIIRTFTCGFMYQISYKPGGQRSWN